MTTPIDHPEFSPVEHLVVLRHGDDDHNESAADSSGFAALLLELMTKAHRVVVVDDAPSVMVELHRGGHAVVLVDHDRPGTGELIAAVTRYYPRVTLWRLAAGADHARPALARIASAASVSAASQPHASPDDPHPHTSDRSQAMPPVTVGTTAIVSDEELAMLLAPLEDAGGTR